MLFQIWTNGNYIMAKKTCLKLKIILQALVEMRKNLNINQKITNYENTYLKNRLTKLSPWQYNYYTLKSIDKFLLCNLNYLIDDSKFIPIKTNIINLIPKKHMLR
ncbi:hypothetical protein BpHYR1_053435 [Brachionus plicatilis]|uniref:Uncharacterized protein n=1 Tax=Brachionus plicatilis TaxID=10195 RepID=A0A3M7QHZ5_BRAPC|nr:hypothetical protein BpHYR1_053435 [Brachionus plicatilis]